MKYCIFLSFEDYWKQIDFIKKWKDFYKVNVYQLSEQLFYKEGIVINMVEGKNAKRFVKAYEKKFWVKKWNQNRKRLGMKKYVA